MLRLGSSNLILGFPRVLGNFRETIAIILRYLLFNNGWGQKKEKKKKRERNNAIMLVIWYILSKLCAIEYAP